MVSTIIFVTLFLGLLMLSVILMVLFLHLGLRWARIAEVTIRRIFLATATVIFLQIVLNVLFRLTLPSTEAHAIFLGLAELAAAVVVPCFVITKVYAECRE